VYILYKKSSKLSTKYTAHCLAPWTNMHFWWAGGKRVDKTFIQPRREVLLHTLNGQTLLSYGQFTLTTPT